ncbi:MAG: hypothetical protein KDL87_00925 [Verrucomicrobiae bacterium]|nr:hypothetical protein [Verrucomicrobiae bacterium]
MPIPYQIYPQHRLVYVRGSGTLRLSEVTDHFARLAVDPAYQAPMLKLVDYRTVNMGELTFAEIRRVATVKEGLMKAFEGERTAFIVDSDLNFGLGRQHQSLMSETNIDVNVFRSFEDAVRWLGLEDLTEQALVSDWAQDDTPSL